MLPSGLPPSTVPPRVTELLETLRAQSGSDNLAPYFKVAQQIAKDSGYDLKVSLPSFGRACCRHSSSDVLGGTVTVLEVFPAFFAMCST